MLRDLTKTEARLALFCTVGYDRDQNQINFWQNYKKSEALGLDWGFLGVANLPRTVSEDQKFMIFRLSDIEDIACMKVEDVQEQMKDCDWRNKDETIKTAAKISARNFENPR